MRRILVAYYWKGKRGQGVGNTGVETNCNYPLEMDDVLNIEKEIEKNIGAKQVIIINVMPLSD